MIRSIQVLRGLAAMAVVWSHINRWESKYLHVAVLPPWFDLGYVGVDLFFVISGFIMVFIQPIPIDSARAHVRFLAHRFTRIYPPYWLVMLPLVPVWLKWPDLFNNFYHHQVDLFRSFFLLPQNYAPLLNVGWSLIHEIYFYIVVSWALRFGKKGRWLFGVTWLTIVLVVSLLWGATGYGGSRMLQLMFSPFSMTFLIGYFLGLTLEWVQKLDFRLGLALGLTGFAAIFFSGSCIQSLGLYPDNNELIRPLAYGLPCGLIVMGALVLERHLPALVARLQYFGDRSYALYLVHPLIVSAFYIFAAKAGWNSPLIVLALAVTCFGLCLLAASVFHEKLEVATTRRLRQVLAKIGLS